MDGQTDRWMDIQTRWNQNTPLPITTTMLCVCVCMSGEGGGVVDMINTIFPGMGIPIIRVRGSWDNVNFTMGIPMLVRWHHFSETTPGIHTRAMTFSDIMTSAMASQIISIWIVFSTGCSGTDHRKHQSSTSLALVRGIHWWPVDSPHKGPVTWKMFPFDDFLMFHSLQHMA